MLEQAVLQMSSEHTLSKPQTFQLRDLAYPKVLLSD